MKDFSEVLKAKKTEFKRLFNLPAVDFMDCMATTFSQKFSIDVIKLNNWLEKNKGYDIDKDGSLQDFIGKTYGEEAKKFLSENI